MFSDDTFDLPLSVDIDLPESYREALIKMKASDENHVTLIFIHGALWAMRASEMTDEERHKEFHALIEDGLNGDSIEMTDELWERFEHHCERHSAWLKTHQVGNTLLPPELYQYIQDKIGSGEFFNATAVVCSALDRNREFRDARSRRMYCTE